MLNSIKTLNITPREEIIEVLMTGKQAKMLYEMCLSIGGGFGKPLTFDGDFANGVYRDVIRPELIMMICEEFEDTFGEKE